MSEMTDVAALREIFGSIIDALQPAIDAALTEEARDNGGEEDR